MIFFKQIVKNAQISRHFLTERDVGVTIITSNLQMIKEHNLPRNVHNYTNEKTFHYE